MSIDWTPDRALYAISVAAELTGVNPQMLRIYENRGLVSPERTTGGTRRYSPSDIERINRIVTLLQAGLNLAGVEQVLALEAETGRLRDEIGRLRRDRKADDEDLSGSAPGRAARRAPADPRGPRTRPRDGR